MKEQNLIGLNKEGASSLANHLNELLANFQVHYQNLRGLHWNIKGNNFFDLHVKFEEYYLDSQQKIDEVAERILTIGSTPLHAFADYLTVSTIVPVKDISEDTAAVEVVLDGLTKLISLERKVLEEAGKLGDEGTDSLMSDFISEQEKTTWMLASWLNRA